MDIMSVLTGGQGASGLDKLGQSLGMDAETTQNLAAQLAPALAGGVKRRAAQEGGMGAILGMLQGEGQAGYAADPAQAASETAQSQGHAFLENIMGNAEAAPKLAQAAAERSGASVEQAQQLLPSLAAMLQGGLQSQAPDDQIGAAQAALQTGGLDSQGAGLGDLMGALGGGGQGGGIMGAISGALSMGGSQSSGGSGNLSGLLAMLDKDGDGNPLDDILEGVMG